MNYSIFLGPTNQAVPDELWDEFKQRDLLFMWSLRFKRISDRHYWVMLDPDFGEAKKGAQSIQVGNTIRNGRIGTSWNAFGSGNFPYVEGFATRLAAAEYMMQAQGYTKRR